MAQYYQVGEQQAGKSVQDIASQISSSGGYVPRLDVLSAMVGLNPESKLTAGQTFKIDNTDPGSGEQKFLSSIFGSPMDENQYQTTQYQKAVQPAVDTLKSGIDPLKDRYSKVIESIKSQRDLAKKKAGIAAAREYAQRGLSTESGDYANFLSEKETPVDVQYGAMETNATGEVQDRINSILSAIASLQGQAGMGGMGAAEAAKTLAETQRQFNSQQELAKAKLDFEKSQASSPDLSRQFTTIPEGNTLFDLLNLSPVYKANKTYKPTGGGSNDPYGIRG